jgi:6-phosphogluconolactonase
MRLEVVPGGAHALAQRSAVWVADQLWSAIAERGVAHLAVSGGTTPKAMFSALATQSLPWAQVHVWQVDERVAPDGDPARNLDDLQAALLSKVPAVAHLLEVTNPDLHVSIAAYAAALHAECDGVLDVVHLGLGPDGHTASWPPGDPVVDIKDVDVARCGVYQEHVRLTLTVPAVNRARQIMFLVSGPDKVEPLGLLLAGDPSIPASRVRRDGVIVLADDAAAAGAATGTR